MAIAALLTIGAFAKARTVRELVKARDKAA